MVNSSVSQSSAMPGDGALRHELLPVPDELQPADDNHNKDVWGASPEEETSPADTILDDVEGYPESLRGEAAKDFLERVIDSSTEDSLPPDVEEGARMGIAAVLGLPIPDNEGEA